MYDEDFGLVADLPMAEEGDSTFVNDVIITKTAAYFTDSFQRKMYKVWGSDDVGSRAGLAILIFCHWFSDVFSGVPTTNQTKRTWLRRDNFWSSFQQRSRLDLGKRTAGCGAESLSEKRIPAVLGF